eukprot:1393163-Amphidinium_carterae.1
MQKDISDGSIYWSLRSGTVLQPCRRGSLDGCTAKATFSLSEWGMASPSYTCTTLTTHADASATLCE